MRNKSYLASEKERFLKRIIPSNKSVVTITRGTAVTSVLKGISRHEYIVVSDCIGVTADVHTLLQNVCDYSQENTRILITSYNFVWEPVFSLLEKINFRTPQPTQNWLSLKDIFNLMYLSNLEPITSGMFLLVPINIPLLSHFLNSIVAKLPIVQHFCLYQYIIARKRPISSNNQYSVSVIIPTRNEAGNIKQVVLRTPRLGTSTELIFVEGGSSDSTPSEIRRVIAKYGKARPIRLISQGKGVGKGDAVRKGFMKATGDILMILDADLTVQPEELPKFYEALRTRKGELIMGSRLVYPMENQAMRFLNILGNKIFGILFSWLLDQPIKDTLCGTKALFKKEYHEIANNRRYFGNFDPFGDFDLIFGAARLHLKIVEIPIRYAARTYGSTNISRFRHGWLLLKMTLFAARKLKFI